MRTVTISGRKVEMHAILAALAEEDAEIARCLESPRGVGEIREFVLGDTEINLEVFSIEVSGICSRKGKIMLQGVLVIVSAKIESDDLTIEVVDLSAHKDIDANFDNDIESALAYVMHIEENEIRSDAEFIVDPSDKLEATNDLRKVEAFTWGKLTAKGYYKIESAWAGGLSEEGAEYRFIPMTRDDS